MHRRQNVAGCVLLAAPFVLASLDGGIVLTELDLDQIIEEQMHTWPREPPHAPHHAHQRCPSPPPPLPPPPSPPTAPDQLPQWGSVDISGLAVVSAGSLGWLAVVLLIVTVLALKGMRVAACVHCFTFVRLRPRPFARLEEAYQGVHEGVHMEEYKKEAERIDAAVRAKVDEMDLEPLAWSLQATEVDVAPPLEGLSLSTTEFEMGLHLIDHSDQKARCCLFPPHAPRRASPWRPLTRCPGHRRTRQTWRRAR